tara:strand:- start:853 stop:1044 length:192 start_codon:yes stop_codon:yes gene_type:complete
VDFTIERPYIAGEQPYDYWKRGLAELRRHIGDGRARIIRAKNCENHVEFTGRVEEANRRRDYS